MSNNLSKKDLEHLISSIEKGYDLNKDDIKLLRKTKYFEKYEYLKKDNQEFLLMHLKEPIARQKLFFYYIRDYGEKTITFYSRNPW